MTYIEPKLLHWVKDGEKEDDPHFHAKLFTSMGTQTINSCHDMATQTTEADVFIHRTDKGTEIIDLRAAYHTLKIHASNMQEPDSTSVSRKRPAEAINLPDIQEADSTSPERIIGVATIIRHESPCKKQKNN